MSCHSAWKSSNLVILPFIRTVVLFAETLTLTFRSFFRNSLKRHSSFSFLDMFFMTEKRHYDRIDIIFLGHFKRKFDQWPKNNSTRSPYKCTRAHLDSPNHLVLTIHPEKQAFRFWRTTHAAAYSAGSEIARWTVIALARKFSSDLQYGAIRNCFFCFNIVMPSTVPLSKAHVLMLWQRLKYVILFG